jgi:hypothetical protein
MEGEKKIFFEDGSEPRNEQEAFQREYRGDVIVELGDGRRFKVIFLTPHRIAQELERMSEFGQPHFVEPSMIVVPDVTTEAIVRAINALSYEEFFDELVPINRER